jgi:signal transduction histidine kinase
VKVWHVTARDPDQRDAVALSKDADDIQKVKPAHGRRTQQGESRPPLLFARADSSLYTSLATLPQRAGVPASMLPWLVVKELCDNALDAADAAGRPGVVEIEIDDQGNLTIADKGAGIPDATPEQIARLFSVGRPMLSSKLLRRPTRGAVGNGLRICLGYLRQGHREHVPE